METGKRGRKNTNSRSWTANVRLSLGAGSGTTVCSFGHGWERLRLGGSAPEWTSIGAEWRGGGRGLGEEGLKGWFLREESYSMVSRNKAGLGVSDGRGIGARSSEDLGLETESKLQPTPEPTRGADVKSIRADKSCYSIFLVLILFSNPFPRLQTSDQRIQRLDAIF